MIFSYNCSYIQTSIYQLSRSKRYRDHVIHYVGCWTRSASKSPIRIYAKRPLDQLINNSGFFFLSIGKGTLITSSNGNVIYSLKADKLKYMKINPWFKKTNKHAVFFKFVILSTCLELLICQIYDKGVCFLQLNWL